VERAGQVHRRRASTVAPPRAATRLPTAYKIATVLDPKRPDAMLKRLFEMKR
jgi:hypothetical protein